jgi:hypothetical protein
MEDSHWFIRLTVLPALRFLLRSALDRLQTDLPLKGTKDAKAFCLCAFCASLRLFLFRDFALKGRFAWRRPADAGRWTTATKVKK